MTELEHIEIEGFKGLEYVEFEPSSINLIAGRNNTGKTSLLEAINLLFNPSSISQFSNDIDRVINARFDEGEIIGHTSNTEINIQLSEPEVNRIGHLFIRSITDITLGQTGLLQFMSDEAIKKERERLQELEPDIRRIFQENMGETDLKSLAKEFLVLSINDEAYPFYSSGPKSYKILSIVGEEFDTGNDIKFDEEIGDFVASVASRTIHGGVTGFLKEPKNKDAINFVNSIDPRGSITRNDDEKGAIKIDNIGDFIKEKELVEDLKTFDIDYLIFENEGGEKYSIPYDFMGDGFKAIVGLLWQLLDENNKNEIVLIEEPENHMHPGYVSELVHFLIDLARDEDIQFFITTHDHDFIKDFFMDMPEEKREYLEGEFSLVKMDDFGADVLDYEDAEHHLKDLHLDLRGI